MEQLGYGTNGYNLINGSTIIFAADTDPQVRNKLFIKYNLLYS
jgi:hypothetical protein